MMQNTMTTVFVNDTPVPLDVHDHGTFVTLGVDDSTFTLHFKDLSDMLVFARMVEAKAIAKVEARYL